MGRDASPPTGNEAPGSVLQWGPWSSDRQQLSAMGIRAVGGQTWGQRLCSDRGGAAALP